MEIFSKFYKKRNRVPAIKKRTRPLHGRVLLTYFKDRVSLSLLCNELEVEFKTDIIGYPLKSTTDGIIEALIHQIIGRDISISALVEALNMEMQHNEFPRTSKEEWETFKLFEAKENYR